jgi:hypothetical protein
MKHGAWNQGAVVRIEKRLLDQVEQLPERPSPKETPQMRHRGKIAVPKLPIDALKAAKVSLLKPRVAANPCNWVVALVVVAY